MNESGGSGGWWHTAQGTTVISWWNFINIEKTTRSQRWPEKSNTHYAQIRVDARRSRHYLTVIISIWTSYGTLLDLYRRRVTKLILELITIRAPFPFKVSWHSHGKQIVCGKVVTVGRNGQENISPTFIMKTWARFHLRNRRFYVIVSCVCKPVPGPTARLGTSIRGL